MTRIIKHQFKPGLPQEFEILDLKPIVEAHQDILTIPHRTEFYHVLWFTKGRPTHLVDFKEIQIVPNTLVFLNKDTVQRYDHKTKFEGKAIIFTERFFCKSAADTRFLKSSILFRDLYSISQIQVGKKLNFFAGLLQQLEEEFHNLNDAYQEEILQNLLHTFLMYCERERRKQGFVEIPKSDDLDYVLLFRDILEREFIRHKQVSFYAGKMHITGKRLNQATTRILDRSPKQIIDERVLLEARRMLAHTTESVKEIAFQLGFEEPTNFNKYFKKHAGHTPASFRENMYLA